MNLSILKAFSGNESIRFAESKEKICSRFFFPYIPSWKEIFSELETKKITRDFVQNLLMWFGRVDFDPEFELRIFWNREAKNMVI